MNTYVVTVQSSYPLCNNDGSPMIPGQEYTVTESSSIDEYVQSNVLSIVNVSFDDPNAPTSEVAPVKNAETKTEIKSKSRLTAPEQENSNG